MALRDKIEGNELDLSLNELTEVPVKELAAASKATHLDLSCNRIKTLPNDFATLVHLVKIDLSRNKLTELPQNFGNLLNLQYLDLDKNELKTIPLSFCRLKNLRWLDLKDNPLEPKLKSVAGDCLDEKQCQTCAKKVVAYMQTIDSNLEREKQKRLKEMREKEALEKARIEKELEQQRKLKKLEKERRKAQSKARNEEKLRHEKENCEKNSNFPEAASGDDVILEKQTGTFGFILISSLIIIFAAIAVYFFTSVRDFSVLNISWLDVKMFLERQSSVIIKTSLKFWNSTFIPFLFSFKASLLRCVHSIMLYISNIAWKIELLLSVYF